MGLLAVLAAAAGVHGEAAARSFEPTPRGCAMAHCDPAMSDLVRLRAPGAAGSAWHDPSAATFSQGLGCSANGRIAVCTSGDYSAGRAQPYLKAYDGSGRIVWDSGTTLNAWAWTSAAAVDRKGGAIAADDTSLVRFAPGGRVRWSTRTPGGAPISPTVLRNGAVVLATRGGPVSAFDSRSGRHLGTLDLRATLGGLSGRFDTTNTPGARGNRVYVSTELTLDDGRPDPNHHARLYAIDVNPRKPAGRRLQIAWHFEFGARSGASPLVVGDTIVFDGDRERPGSPEAPRFFGVRDLGRRPKPVWQHELDGRSQASAARDPRGGAWVFAFGHPLLRRVSIASGRVRQTIDVDALVDAEGIHVPYSAMSVATGRGGRPVMLVTARAGLTSAYLVAIDLARERLVWKWRLPGDVRLNTPMGQFPIVTRPDGRRAVVFSMRSGVRAVVGR
jgi:putative pyrroloquinoline-quinone binding quinoprotein